MEILINILASACALFGVIALNLAMVHVTVLPKTSKTYHLATIVISLAAIDLGIIVAVALLTYYQ